LHIHLNFIWIASLDQNIVLVALPSVVRDLGHQELYAWVAAAYLLTSSATSVLYGLFILIRLFNNSFCRPFL